jgi:glycyl-tRNA synthetase
LPYVIEPSLGLDRAILAFITNAYTKETLENGEERVVLKIHPYLAPVKVTILPLIKKIHSDAANDVYARLCKSFNCSYDDAGSIGKRYRRSDAVGTPFCITIDDETLNNKIVTIRERDTMEQVKIPVNELEDYIKNRINF